MKAKQTYTAEFRAAAAADEQRSRTCRLPLRYRPVHGHGTPRTPAIARRYALLASVIETCRLCVASIIDLLADSINAARSDLPAPAPQAIRAA